MNVWSLVLLIVVPFVVYFSVKFGTFGYYRGRQLFQQYEKKKKESDDG